MSLLGLAVALLALAAITQLGVVLIERSHAPAGRFVEVAGGRLHVVELGPDAPATLPVVLIHGASSNLEAMRRPLGDLLGRKHRVILIDRPGHGWSTREQLSASTPAIQARMIDEALGKLGVARAVVVGAMPVVGPLFAYTLALPTGALMLRPGARGAFLPQTMPEDYVRATALPLLLRPREFLANAWDMATLKAAVTAQMQRYGEIRTPAILLHGDVDKSVYLSTHSQPFAKAVPHVELIVLPGIGHLVQNAVPEQIAAAVERLMPQAAARAHAPAVR